MQKIVQPAGFFDTIFFLLFIFRLILQRIYKINAYLWL